MPAMEDVFMPDIIGDVVERDGATSMLRLLQKTALTVFWGVVGSS